MVERSPRFTNPLFREGGKNDLAMQESLAHSLCIVDVTLQDV